ncbi:tRNA 2-thiouridine(34) synthase MnmA [Helicobacter sp. 11S02629-2]|uniref:tRNA 2-thiouridine(34) synthase MnmA n=1 Tax=Helicobacter sp. 11S02629-2 TaxID=1476195 RepID=UPI000BA59CFE|nr:tRNA 2-thiouridine(34) synthase MnmA [Helicobacter sp. 11S02629-2]PAF45993.1 tRNA 2-thiouridine(34) synthase MnmA [Helicobacter sp. 11S02629-2]
MKGKKIAHLMSGGVDSSYCAYLLKQQGYEVLGMYLKLHNKDKKHDIFIKNCEEVSRHLDIEFIVIDAKKEFKASVYDYFIDSYKEGITPNPCAVCNPLMKFGLALQKAKELGCEYISTGHYARIETLDGVKRIRCALDESKDQSYFLYGLSQDALDRLIFPLGDMKKVDIKPIALKEMPFLGTLETYKDSQEICFVDKSYIDLLKEHLEVEREGDVLDTKGNIVGKHKGYMQYTIGKRKGFSVKGALTPHFVLDINPKLNQIIVGDKKDLETYEVKAINKSLPTNFVNGIYNVKVRYRSAFSKAEVSLNSDNTITARLKAPVYGVAKGQALVIYTDDVVVGGGVIV